MIRANRIDMYTSFEIGAFTTGFWAVVAVLHDVRGGPLRSPSPPGMHRHYGALQFVSRESFRRFGISLGWNDFECLTAAIAFQLRFCLAASPDNCRGLGIPRRHIFRSHSARRSGTELPHIISFDQRQRWCQRVLSKASYHAYWKLCMPH